MENKKETPAQIAERALRNFNNGTPIPVLLDAVEKALSKAIEIKKLEDPTFDSEDFKKGDFLVAYVPGYFKICVFINLSEKLSIKDVFRGIPAGAYLHFEPIEFPNLGLMEKLYLPTHLVRICHASEEDKEFLLNALNSKGFDWDAEKCRIVELRWEPKEGDTVFVPHCSLLNGKFKAVRSFWNVIAELGRRDWVFRTEEEAQALCDKLNSAIKDVSL